MTAPDPRVGEIEARLSAATPGPWSFWRWDMSVWQAGRKRYVAGIETYTHGTPSITEGDGEFIAHAPADVAYLLAELRKAHEALARVEALHQREVIAVHEGYGEEAICTECGHRWPCDTRAAVAAAKGDGE